MTNIVKTRLLVLTVTFLAAAGYVAFAMEPELVPLREPLRNLTTQLGPWTGQEAPKLTDEVLAVLGVDEYLNRYYVAAPAPPVSLYVGYYQSQREGDTIHSPMNCLPGAGWQPSETSRVDLEIPGRTSPGNANRVIIQKGLDRQYVLYWYQSHGRVVASEYWSKVLMVSDAIRWNRSDAALVRVVTPIDTAGGVNGAERRASEFVAVLFPELERSLPSATLTR